jgi:glycerate-2-kinase
LATVKNRNQIISNGKSEKARFARSLILDCYQEVLSQVDPAKLIKSKLTYTGSTLHIGDLSFDLDKYKNIYVVGGGKASGDMAVAVEQILGERITKGIINVPKGCKAKTKHVALNQASHPVPDQAGVEGTMKMLEIAQQAGKDDLLICLLSGGGSSLMPLPREGLTLNEKQELTQTLLKSGAKISEINAVRKHLSAFKGGNLAKEAAPATVLSLIISDVVGDVLGDIASGPTAPDKSTFQDAKETLEKYNIWDEAPSSVRDIILQGIDGLIPETQKPNNAIFKNVHNVIIASNPTACTAAKKFFESKSFKTCLLTCSLEGEARQVAAELASIIRNEAGSKQLIAVIAGGETTVTVTGKGVGGRNQELSLAMALQLRGFRGFVFASLSTDGVDGPTDAAGAVIDECTLERAELAGLNPKRYLLENDSYRFFSGLEDLVFTGLTGTNVNDVAVALCYKP